MDSFEKLPGAQREIDVIEDEEGHGAAILSLKSHVKLKPVTLSNITSVGRLRRRHPAVKKRTINTWRKAVSQPFSIAPRYHSLKK